MKTAIFLICLFAGCMNELQLSELVKARAEMDKVLKELNQKPQSRKLFDHTEEESRQHDRPQIRVH